MAMGIHKFSGKGRRGRGARSPMAEINVTPLVDVMLVLLIIFMVTAPLLKAGIPIQLPDSRAKPLDHTPHQVTVTMDKEGTIYLDDDQIAPGELADRITALPKDDQGQAPLVVLRADKALDYGRVISVMGELNHAGVTAISLVTVAGGDPVQASAKSGN
ncbi:MAG: biopolymer transporter ExbD [Sphingomonadales bacterium]|nr:biopolymer transporter ExbD [Sphingomonadales bacterium]MDE2169552.1 biopolymer transporter ExbD [Sphingomonadales bacterium]